MIFKTPLKARSLRSWIIVAMALAMMPIVFSAALGFLLLDRGVIAPIHDVASRLRLQIEPVQNLRVMIWDATGPVDEYAEDGNVAHADAYRKIRIDVETEFASLFKAAADVPSAAELVARARITWTSADDIATKLISGTPSAQDPLVTVLALEQFHGSIRATSDRLEAAHRQLADRVAQDHDMAVLSYERSMWVAGIAAGISLLALIGGVAVIGRVLTASVDRLVAGVARFSEGDRNHRIHVNVPPELSRVAQEFNYMIGRIDESERALAELANADGLTGISNRRAFDIAFAEAFSKHLRTGHPASLLSIDLDHFKRINDTWGHPAGDEVLRMAARAMTENIRSTDRLFRMGGEEFCVVMSDASVEKAVEVAERLRLSLHATKVPFENEEIRFTVSIGVAGFGDGATPEDVIAAADAALYRAKSGGRNRLGIDGRPDNQDQNVG
ncbi:MAG: diguanylate cyclase [Cypionkella sp.]